MNNELPANIRAISGDIGLDKNNFSRAPREGRLFRYPEYPLEEANQIPITRFKSDEDALAWAYMKGYQQVVKTRYINEKKSGYYYLKCLCKNIDYIEIERQIAINNENGRFRTRHGWLIDHD